MVIILVPLEKKDHALKALRELIKKRMVTVHRLQQIVGFLNHLCKAIFPARSFTRRFYYETAGLKQYHHINVDHETKADVKVWIDFLHSDPMAVCRPFVDLSESITAKEIGLFTDASGALNKGLGGVLTDKGR